MADSAIASFIKKYNIGKKTVREPEKVPEGFRTFTGRQNLDTEKLLNIGGKTYIGPKYPAIDVPNVPNVYGPNTGGYPQGLFTDPSFSDLTKAVVSDGYGYADSPDVASRYYGGYSQGGEGTYEQPNGVIDDATSLMTGMPSGEFTQTGPDGNPFSYVGNQLNDTTQGYLGNMSTLSMDEPKSTGLFTSTEEAIAAYRKKKLEEEEPAIPSLQDLKGKSLEEIKKELGNPNIDINEDGDLVEILEWSNEGEERFKEPLRVKVLIKDFANQSEYKREVKRLYL